MWNNVLSLVHFLHKVRPDSFQVSAGSVRPLESKKKSAVVASVQYHSTFSRYIYCTLHPHVSMERFIE